MANVQEKRRRMAYTNYLFYLQVIFNKFRFVTNPLRFNPYTHEKTFRITFIFSSQQ